MRLDDVRGFVFDVDGSLVHRDADVREGPGSARTGAMLSRSRPLPGAVAVLEAIRASGRPLVLFTNGSHLLPETFARGLRDDGLPVADHELLTPVDSALSYLRRRHRDRRVMVFGADVVRERMADAGVRLTEADAAEAVFVAHVDEADLPAMERAARAVSAGAPLLTANWRPGFWTANGLTFSRGAMVTAAIARAAAARPIVVGKPSKAAIREASERLGVPAPELAVIGDDLYMDVALGHLGGSRTILVRSGTSADEDLSRVPERKRPHAVVDGVEELLAWL